ncbi:MAG: peptide-binding protein [Candidatus Marinarcus sp.]|uniref:peptide-binding protein n=1 Tax=Candidatus Marinarcus sp. TaxID=3100987 RepID=UPI003AFF9551
MKKLLSLFIIHFSLFTLIQASTLNLSINENPSRLNPILSNDSASSEISDWLFDGLFKYDKNGLITTNLAQSYHFENKLKLIIKLRHDVLWHDGEKFTANDVLFTYHSIINPKIFTSIASNYNKVASVKALDDYTLEIIYKESYFKALQIWMVGILPEHILKNEPDMMSSSFNKNPIGTGAYKLKTFVASNDIKLIANDHYFLGRPKIDEIVYKFLPDPSTSFLMLKQNQLDIGSLTPLQVDRQIDETFKKEYTIIEQPSFAYAYLGFNLKDKKFQDLKVRQALSLGINRKELVDILFFGHARVCTGPFLPGSFAFNDQIPAVKQDIKKAKALLKEAGYDETHPFTFTTVTNTGNETRINAAEIIQYQLAKIGVKMNIRVMEWQAYLNTVVHPRKYEAILLGWKLALMPDAYPLWHSASDKKGAFNFVGYHNKEVDRLIEEASVTIDQKQLGVYYKKIFKHITDDIPYLFLYIPNSISAVNASIKNIEPTFIGIMHNQIDWIKPEETQGDK